ncbi:hypothetical protein C0989_008476 [Termitomyces sp. Mn162]|nr:hypothetical protein C0989_008476 [Termitomyces sp. Mn162]
MVVKEGRLATSQTNTTLVPTHQIEYRNLISPTTPRTVPRISEVIMEGRNCPSKGKAKSNNGKPPGISAFGGRMDLAHTKQLRIDGLAETTELSIGMVEIGEERDNLPVVIVSSDSEEEQLPDLDSVLDSEVGWEDNYDQLSSQSPTLDDMSEGMLEDSYDDSHEEILLALPIAFERCYHYTVENSEEKNYIINIRNKCRCLGDAACNKLEEMLEITQPYPGDPINVLQFHG